MNHQKEEVLPAAEGLWPDILLSITNIDSKFFNGKNQPCPICGGKDRARYIAKHELPFHCNQCGDKSGINFYMQLTGIDFNTAINDVGDYLNLIPTERREQAKREHKIITSFPDWYNYDVELYSSIKKAATVDLSAWQRLNGLNMLDILKHGENALIPLLDRSGKPCDFVMIDPDGDWQTTGGNKSVPVGFYATFGDEQGKRTYLTVSPFVAAHASIFTGKQVVCCFEEENIGAVVNNFDGDIVAIVSNLSEVTEADTLHLPQLTYNAKNNTVNRRLYQPFEIMEKRK